MGASQSAQNMFLFDQSEAKSKQVGARRFFSRAWPVWLTKQYACPSGKRQGMVIFHRFELVLLTDHETRPCCRTESKNV